MLCLKSLESLAANHWGRAYLRFAIQQSTFLNPGFFTNPPLMIWWSWLPFLQEYIIWNLTEWNMLALLSRWSCFLPGPGFLIGTRTSKSSTISTGSGSSLSLWFIFGKIVQLGSSTFKRSDIKNIDVVIVNPHPVKESRSSIN